MEKVNLHEFDILGFFTLQDAEGIEHLTTKVNDKTFLSRSVDYYKQKSYTEASNEREALKNLLAKYPQGKKAFIIIERMLTNSAKVYYSESCSLIEGFSSEETFSAAQLCMQEDCSNLIKIIRGEPIVPSNSVLPQGKRLISNRQIELDNKALLYIFCDLFKKVSPDTGVITPGLGGIYLGPFFKEMYGCNYALVNYSEYKGKNIESPDITKVITNPALLKESKGVLLLDDNAGTGTTLETLRNLVLPHNPICKYGAVQYNWINYAKVETGEKNIPRFNVASLDCVTPLHYPGHNLLEHAIDVHLAESGENYINYIKSKSYRKEERCDLTSLIEKGKENAKIGGVSFNRTENNNATEDKRLTETSVKLSEGIIERIYLLEQDRKLIKK